jgi:hypothetical protein
VAHPVLLDFPSPRVGWGWPSIPFFCVAGEKQLMRAPSTAAVARVGVGVVFANVVNADVWVGSLGRDNIGVLVHHPRPGRDNIAHH